MRKTSTEKAQSIAASVLGTRPNRVEIVSEETDDTKHVITAKFIGKTYQITRRAGTVTSVLWVV